MRQTGILLHISSLPGAYGIGSFGKEAYQFVDFLVSSGQTYWQILPLGPTSFGDSPYQCSSIYAGNPYFINIDMLIENGLINYEDINYYDSTEEKVNYLKQFNFKIPLLSKCYHNKKSLENSFTKFLVNNDWWLDDYALYSVLKIHNDHQSWQYWPNDYRFRNQEALSIFVKDNKEEIETHKFIQFLFFDQWFKLKQYANEKGIKIIGDMPIYVAYDSVEVWKEPSNFLLDKDYLPTQVAGVPPDAFSKTGQLWGNPLYDWSYMKENKYRWWIKRVKHMLSIYDFVRIDHFRGFSRYYCIPYGLKDATVGYWSDGPGEDLFSAIKKEIGDEGIIAEDLGFLDDQVYSLLKSTGFPGMKVLQFELTDEKAIDKIVKQFNENTILYTGTHDNEPIVGWYYHLNNKTRNLISQLLHIDSNDMIQWKFIELAYQSKAKIVIIPFQDILGLSTRYRMNKPSTMGKNWVYRARSIDFTEQLSNQLLSLVNKYKEVKK